MKNIYLSVFSLMLVIGASSCNDLLEQSDPNAVTVDDYFKTENDIQLAVNGIYQSLRSSDAVGENSGLYTDERSDDTGTNDNQSNSGEPFQFNNFSLLPSNTWLKNHWNALYQTITRSNIVLSNIDNITFSDAENKAKLTAEAKFLRAYIYFQLVRKWGDVPLVTKQLKTTEEITMFTARVKKEEVYNQIVSDLKDVIASPLANLQTGANVGRVSKAAGNALLGQVYLTMATTLDQSGKAANLASAKTYLEAAYAMKTFGSLKEIPYTDVFDVAKKSTCPELIFQIVNKQGDLNYSSTIAATTQAKGETINSLKPSTGTGTNVTHDLVNDYEKGDLRKDFSIKYASDVTVQDWFITKFRDASTTAGVNGYGGNDWVLIRYADVILMLAEVNMYLGNDTQAITYLDMVRERAKMPAYAVSKLDASYSSKYPTLKLAILHERRVELAFEHHRWFDLLRTFTTQELMSYMQSKNQQDFGNAKLSNFSLKDRYYPIPFDENKLDPVKMYQNEGY
ncbi:RagB/SusD family nutrient uptake outer membrane protein [Dyadobacter sp. CY356]|uniref:RagB/SusD family nutrient uptake outer membrane protein n=1 Tax=Dyadobacter sp. CY356 TaxID=2906442 RepID=UPI001F441CC0|nr:RagB/SusD family nutrient uptake outer membrane protein [Dyadobacter sp. CY356]MCF0054514.1 RagB/SusD family nutrient uptake outer membrane protein [Dyadobacter sp. CY356]